MQSFLESWTAVGSTAVAAVVGTLADKADHRAKGHDVDHPSDASSGSKSAASPTKVYVNDHGPCDGNSYPHANSPKMVSANVQTHVGGMDVGGDDAATFDCWCYWY